MRKAVIAATVFLTAIIFSIFYFYNQQLFEKRPGNPPEIRSASQQITTKTLSPDHEKHIVQKQKIAEEYGKIPLHFEPNLGQTDERVRFTARGRGYGLYLTDTEAVLSLEKRGADEKRPKRAVVRMTIDGARPAQEAVGLDETNGRSNYFIGRDPKNWRTNVPNYEKVRFSKIYEGVDLVYYGNNRRLEYDFVLAPYSDPAQIKLKFTGIEQARIDDSTGDLLLETAGETIRQHKPFSYQVVDGRQKEIASVYQLKKTGRSEYSVSFAVADYEPSRELVIDPILVYGSYLGGSEFDRGSGIAIDSAGSAYITGSASSHDFPTTPGTVKPQMLEATWTNAFVTKMNPAGTGLVFSTYYGGHSASASGSDIEIDDAGNVYLLGSTLSSDLPVVNAYQNAVGGTDDAFLAKLDPTGSSIIYSTYLGGNNTDLGGRIAVERATGEATVIGTAYSPDFPTTPGALKEKICNSPQTCSGIFYSGSFVARFAAGGAIVYATLFNAKLADVALDANNNAVIAGTGSAALTTPGAYQTSSTGGVEGYLGKLNPAGGQIVFGTLLGGGFESDVISAVALDSSGNMYVAGTTENAGFPTTPGAFDTTFNGTTGNNHDGFVTKFDPAGSSLVFSTFLGGTGRDEPKEIGLGADDSPFVVGETTGAASFPLKNSILNAGNIFLTHLTGDAAGLVYSTILGQGEGRDLAVDAAGNSFVTGKTNNIPTTPGAFQTLRGGGQATSPDDAFVLKIGPTDETVTHYAISGTVRDENVGYNNNYTPVVATITGTVNRTINLSHSGGPYFFGNLPAGGNYTVTVSKTGFETAPQSAVFDNLGANQFADFTILRNREPMSVITTPANGATYQAPAAINIQATASDPDEGDTIRKVEFVAFNSAFGLVPIGTDTEAPYETTWNNVPSGTWSIYAYPYDNHGLRGFTNGVVHVFVTEPNGPGVTLTSPTDGQTFTAGDYVPLTVSVSPSVTKVDYLRDGTLIGRSISSPFTMQIRFTDSGSYAITAKAYNSQNQSTVSNVANITIAPFIYTISGRITNSIDLQPVEGVTVNLASPSNPSITGTTTTDANGDYVFGNISASASDAASVTPVDPSYTFSPTNRLFTLGYSNHTNRNFSAVPVSGITVAMTSPLDYDQFPSGASVPLAADASSTAGGITKVEFYEYISFSQRNLIAVDTTAPYAFDWTGAGGGYHNVYARAFDTDGGIRDSGIVIFRVVSPPTSIRLQGTVTDAANNPMSGITVRLTGSVSGQPVNQTVPTGFFGTYGFFNLTPGGDYTITPEAPNTTFTPPSVTIPNAVSDNFDINFQAGSFNQPPVVQINNPADGAVFTMPVTIQMTATATDTDGSVTHFRMTAVGPRYTSNIGEVNNGTFSVPWQPSEPGDYTIWAVARDNGGIQTSEQISITVNPPPPVSISGRVVDRTSSGITGVTMELRRYGNDDSVIATALTDATGSYSLTGIPTFDTYTVTPVKEDYAFTPQRRFYSNLTTDQTNGDYTGTLQVQPSDFDGDSISDVAVWRPSSGVWYVKRSTDSTFSSIQFGGGSFGDEVVPGNYDGDRKIDYAVYRAGTWYILNSSNQQTRVAQFGLASDKAVPGDYDGDGKTDLAVWRPENGVWYIWRSSDGGYDFRPFGLEGDIPLAGDYDGDGKTDLTVFRPSSGVWYVMNSSDASFRAFQFGTAGDKPLVGDFDGDKRADFAVFRPADGVWHIWQSGDDSYRAFQWGIATDMPVPGDYDRDGKTDFAVYRKTEGNWYIFKSATNSYSVQNFGLGEDIPIPAAFVR